MQVIGSHPDVAECAVIGAEDQLKGEVPLGLIVLKVHRCLLVLFLLSSHTRTLCVL